MTLKQKAVALIDTLPPTKMKKAIEYLEYLRGEYDTLYPLSTPEAISPNAYSFNRLVVRQTQATGYSTHRRWNSRILQRACSGDGYPLPDSY